MTDESVVRIVVIGGVECEAYFLPNGVECVLARDAGIAIDVSEIWPDELTGHVPLFLLEQVAS